jgi:hypothetical protein
MIVNKVDKKIKVSIDDVIRYQILTYCFFNNIQISKSDVDCLAELSKNNNIGITAFCDLMTNKKIFKSAQSARNAITKAEKKNLLKKNGKPGKNKKTISISSDLNIQTEGVVLLDFKILGSESQKA